MRVAYFSPLPPSRSGIADYSEALIASLKPLVDLEVFSTPEQVYDPARFDTYAIEGQAGSGTVCVNGAAARLVQVGDPIIVISYAQMTPDEARRHRPTIVLLNGDNSVRETRTADPGRPIGVLSESV